jgi:hypothetical protein
MSLNENHRQSIVALAEKSPYVSYADLHVVLGTQNDLELEKLIVEAIYEGTITVGSCRAFNLINLHLGKA